MATWGGRGEREEGRQGIQGNSMKRNSVRGKRKQETLGWTWGRGTWIETGPERERKREVRKQRQRN